MAQKSFPPDYLDQVGQTDQDDRSATMLFLQNLSNEEQVVAIHARTVLTLAEKVTKQCLNMIHDKKWLSRSVSVWSVVGVHRRHKDVSAAEDVGHRDREGKHWGHISSAPHPD